ncbi:SRPBCC family protein [Frankia sp. AgB1.9]|uniref:SRPBCC family protein n=1 Tax=unclassified Frankia TaxID=2632575 RepID=UPI0019326B5E|nr:MULTISPECIES: SRPBCC family protein [unclassified Frankia]MBL7489147.1 SRPBCC family protein [Frankia sp. AgW1.1]MBL7554145.1 SRPBCC family protein [Frankia sp. AgB1.9]MBL7618495.1 SRPBCC family protein [Frankia sp. AgB1.8]
MPETGVAYCLERVGLAKPDWKTLVVEGSGTSKATAADLWAVWSDLEHWPNWSPIHRSVAPVDANTLSIGGSFDQELGLGFPVGVQHERATFDEFQPAAQVSWSGDKNGIRSCHRWQFQPTPDGGTRIHNVEIFVGTTMGLIKPLVGRRWNRLFQRAVDGLIAATTGAAEGSPRGR